MSIQPVNKAVEHLINSYDQYWKRKAVNAYLIKNRKGEEKEKDKNSHTHKQLEGLGRVLWVCKVGLK